MTTEATHKLLADAKIILAHAQADLVDGAEALKGLVNRLVTHFEELTTAAPAPKEPAPVIPQAAPAAPAPAPKGPAAAPLKRAEPGETPPAA